MKFRVSSIYWAAVVILGISVIAFFKVVFDWPDAPKLDATFAAWVQAVGSLVAIAVVFYINNSQREYERGLEEQRELDHIRRMRDIFKRSADSHCSQLRVFCDKLNEATTSGEKGPVTEYFSLGLNLHWSANLFIFNSFPVVDLARAEIQMINELKVGAEYAKSICEYVQRVGFDKLDLARTIGQIDHHLAMALTVVGVFETQEKQSRLARRG